MNGRIVAGAALLLSMSLPSLAVQERMDPFSLGEPLVLSFRQDRVRLMDGVLGFLGPEGEVYLPLDEVCRGLGLAIKVDVPGRWARGFYLSEENGFVLDLARRSVESAGQLFEIQEGSVFATEMELYVDVETLAGWLRDVRLIYHRASLAIEVKSDPPLPAVARLRRQGVRNRVSKIETARPWRELPPAVAGYRFASLPVIDVDSTFRWSSEQERSLSMGMRGAQDIAGMGARWFIGLDARMKLRDTRLTLRRKDPSGGLMGPLALTEIGIGDVDQFGAPLIGGSRGAGFRITNRLRDVNRGATLDLRGELPEGWEAELYRSGVLVGFDIEAERGEYLFGDVPLFPGVNELLVVRHGPQGQRDETRKTVRLGGDQPAPGRWFLEASALLQQQPTLALERLQGEESDLRGDDPDQGELAAEARFSLGLKPGLSFAGSLSTMSLDGQRLAFAGLSTDLFLRTIDLTLDGAIDQRGNWAAGGQVVARLGDFGIFLQHQEFATHFRSPSSARSRPLRRRSELRVRRGLDLPHFQRPLQAVLRAKFESRVEGASKMDFRLGLSTSVGALRIQNEFSGGWARDAGRHRHDPLEGNFNLSLRHLGALRAGLSYSLIPQARLRSIKLSARWSLFDGGLQVNPALHHEIGGNTSLGVGLGWNFPQVEVSTQLNADTAGSFSATLGLRFSLSWRDRSPRPILDRRPQASQSLAYTEVFLDEDQDGRRSPGERSLAGVRFTPGSRQELTDDRGSLTLSGLSELVPTDVLLDEGSLPDPFLRPTIPGYRVSARPGAPLRLLFPVVWVGDIEGRILVTEETVDADGTPIGLRTRELGNVEIVILDTRGEEVSRHRSEFDGFFFVPSLPVGTYRLRMDAIQATRFGLDDGGGIEVTIRADTAILSGLELHLRSSKRARPQPS